MRRRVAKAVIAIAILGIISWLAVPTYRYLMHGKWQRDTERSALGSLRTVWQMEKLFRKQVEIDQDGDGMGEYGWLNELCGGCPPRRKDTGSQPAPVSPVYLSTSFYSPYYPDENVACARRPNGSFVLFLPCPDTGGMDDRIVAEHLDWRKWSPPLDPGTQKDTIELQEKHFVVYVVPIVFSEHLKKEKRAGAGQSLWMLRRSKVPRSWDVPARYTYAINEKGEVHYTAMEHKKYLWPESHVTDYRAAFVDDGSTDTVFNNPLADGQKGFDGNIWYKLKE